MDVNSYHPTHIFSKKTSFNTRWIMVTIDCKIENAHWMESAICTFPGSQPKVQKPAATNDTNKEPVEKSSVPPPKKKVDINEPRTCRNKGCGKSYKEKDNHDSACDYHPGPAVFHDRMRGWKCCNIHVKEFDEFMEIPPCTKGWHNADAVWIHTMPMAAIGSACKRQSCFRVLLGSVTKTLRTGCILDCS